MELFKLIVLGIIILVMLGFLATAHVWMVPKHLQPQRKPKRVDPDKEPLNQAQQESEKL